MTSTCTATVQQAFACATDVSDGLVAGTEPLPTCDQITFEDQSRVDRVSEPPAPNCAALNATCN